MLIKVLTSLCFTRFASYKDISFAGNMLADGGNRYRRERFPKEGGYSAR